jgi:predicted metal-dependent phosphoesterase TrpH
MSAEPPVPGSRAPAGRVRLDCHVHTVASGDAVLTVEQLARRARPAGLDVVCITDHNLTSAAVAAAQAAARGDLDIRIIVGEEIRTPVGDVIGLFLTERIPYVLPLTEVVARIRDQGGLVYVPHPFDQSRSSLGRELTSLCAEGSVDIIEVFNAKIDDQALNEKAAAVAAEFGIPAAAGSDAHDPDGVGAAYLDLPDFDGPASLLGALSDARIAGEHRPHAIRYPRRGTGSTGLQADPGGQALAMVGAVAEEKLAGLGSLEVQMSVVLPGKADTAVDLDVLGGYVEVRFRRVGL